MLGKKTLFTNIDLSGLPDEFAWYSIVTMFNMEEAYLKNVMQVIRNNDLEDNIDEYYLPVSFTKRIDRKMMKDGMIKETPRIRKSKGAYSNYIFIKCKMNSTLWNILRTTTGVSVIPTYGGHPIPISDDEVRKIKLINQFVESNLSKTNFLQEASKISTEEKFNLWIDPDPENENEQKILQNRTAPFDDTKKTPSSTVSYPDTDVTKTKITTNTTTESQVEPNPKANKHSSSNKAFSYGKKKPVFTGLEKKDKVKIDYNVDSVNSEDGKVTLRKYPSVKSARMTIEKLDYNNENINDDYFHDNNTDEDMTFDNDDEFGAENILSIGKGKILDK